MPAGLFLLIVVALITFVIIFIVVSVWRATSPPRGPDRRTREYINELEETIDNLQALAYDNKTLDPSFADIVIDELRQHKSRIKRKELEP